MLRLMNAHPVRYWHIVLYMRHIVSMSGMIVMMSMIMMVVIFLAGRGMRAMSLLISIADAGTEAIGPDEFFLPKAITNLLHCHCRHLKAGQGSENSSPGWCDQFSLNRTWHPGSLHAP